MTVTANPTTYKQMLVQAANQYLTQHHFFTASILASHWFPLDSEATFDRVAKTVINALAAQGPIDWSAVGTPAVLTSKSALRDAIVQQIVGILFPGVQTVSGFLITAYEFIAALVLGQVQTQLATGNYGSDPAQQFAQVQIWQQQANTIS